MIVSMKQFNLSGHFKYIKDSLQLTENYTEALENNENIVKLVVHGYPSH